MKIKKQKNGYKLISENKRENEIIAVLVNLVDYNKIPITDGVHDEGCIYDGGREYNYLTIPFYEGVIQSGISNAALRLTSDDATLLSDCILLKLKEIGETEQKHGQHLKESFFEMKRNLLRIHSHVCSLLDE